MRLMNTLTQYPDAWKTAQYLSANTIPAPPTSQRYSLMGSYQIELDIYQDKIIS